MKLTEKMDSAESTSVVTPELPATKLTLRENVLYTIAIVGAMGLIGAVLWGVGLWMSPR
jgi:hypothetical protein